MSQLLVVRGPDNGRRWTLPKGQILIGRDASCQIILSDRHVSRQHCRIERAAGRLLLTNLSTTNGTLVNGARVLSACLNDGDEIRLGDTTLSFVYEADTARAGLEANPADAVVIVGDEQERRGEEFISFKFDSRADLPKAVTDLAEAARRIDAFSRRFEIIRSVGDSVVSELDLDRLFDLILDQVFAFVNAERGCVMTYDRASGQFVPRATRQRDKGRGGGGMRMSRSIINVALRERVAVLSTDATRDQRFSTEDSVILQGIRSVMSAPMMFKDEPLGIISVDNRDMINAFAREDLETLSIIANLAATAIHNARMVHERIKAETTRQNFERFLPPSLVREFVDEGRELKLGGEKANVTVLFADIRNFTPLCEARPAEEIVRLLNIYFQELTACIFRNGGTLDKYVGDSVLAVFGCPDPYPEHTLRAARTALEMAHVLATHPILSREVKAGIALHRGDAIHGFVGSEQRMQYTVIGDTVNTASRLCDGAAGNQVVVSQSVVDAEGPRLRFRPVSPSVVQGKTEPLKRYELIGVSG
jgi:adenylate cyclase